MTGNSYNGILNSNENEWTATACNSMDESQEIMLNKRSQPQKEYQIYSSICIKLKYGTVLK